MGAAASGEDQSDVLTLGSPMAPDVADEGFLLTG
jgi:hypothetical protein